MTQLSIGSLPNHQELRNGMCNACPSRTKQTLALLLFLFVSYQLQATTYYVATNGNNSWSGKTNTIPMSGTNGPWLDFIHVNYGGNTPLQPGDVLYIGGGIYDHSSDSLETALFITGVSGTPSNPIVISNYPGETPIISGSGSNNCTIRLDTVAWVKLFGIDSTNPLRGIALQHCTNCELAYCTSSCPTNLFIGAPFSLVLDSQSNWIHNNLFFQAIAIDELGISNYDGGTHLATIGTFYSTNDFTSYNIIESNICYWAGHDCMSCYGPSNVIQYNWCHSAPWYYMSNFEIEAGSRVMEVGGANGNYNLIQNNDFDYAGIVPDAGSHGIEGSSSGYTIIRYNIWTDIIKGT